MQRFKVYVDVENIKTTKKISVKERGERPALGEIKNTIVTRSKYLELNNGLKNIKLKDPIKPKKRSSVFPKKVVKRKVSDSPLEINKSPQVTRKRRLSSLFRVSEYANDIYKYLQKIEDKYPIRDCAKIEKKFGECTRFALVDWYVQEDDSLVRNDLQLIALAAAFLASKYEEIVPMEINDLLFVCDSALSAEEILKMETKIVTQMQYSFGRPVPAHFIRRYCNVIQATSVEQSCAFYLSDVALMSYKLCHLRPSIIAASALYIALCVSNGQDDVCLWNSTLIKYSTYEIHDLEDCVTTLARCLIKLSSTRFQALQRKYSKPKHFNVSQLPELMAVIENLAL